MAVGFAFGSDSKLVFGAAECAVGESGGGGSSRRSYMGADVGLPGNEAAVVTRAARSKAIKVLPEPEGPARRTILPLGNRFRQSQQGAIGGRLARQLVEV